MAKIVTSPFYKPNVGMDWIARRPLKKDGSVGVVTVIQVTDAFISDTVGFVGTHVVVRAHDANGVPFFPCYPLEAFYYSYKPHCEELENAEEEFALAT